MNIITANQPKPEFKDSEFLTLGKLILILMWAFLKGHREIYYHICKPNSEGCFYYPMSINSVDLRVSEHGKERLTIW